MVPVLFFFAFVFFPLKNAAGAHSFTCEIMEACKQTVTMPCDQVQGNSKGSKVKQIFSSFLNICFLTYIQNSHRQNFFSQYLSLHVRNPWVKTKHYEVGRDDESIPESQSARGASGKLV